MWLKSMQVCRFLAPQGRDVEDYMQGLKKQVLQECPSTVAQAYGWQHPFADAEEVVLGVGDYYWANFVVAKRILPADVVKQALAQRVALLEQQEGVGISKREQRRLQDEIHFELLPKAFVQYKTFPVCWQASTQTLFVACTQTAVLDMLAQSLAYCCPGWRLQYCQPKQPVQRCLRAWLLGEQPMPKAWSWGDSCQLQDRANRYCTIRFAGMDIVGDEVRRHVQEGMEIKQAALVWEDKIRFVLAPNMAWSQIKYLDIAREDGDGLSAQEQYIADAGLLSPLYEACNTAVLDAFGGEVQVDNTAKHADVVEMV